METQYMRYQPGDGSFVIGHTISRDEIYNMKFHTHKEYEIFMLMSEKASFQVESRRYQLGRGDIMIFNSRESHKVEYDPDKPYERWVVHFNKELTLPFTTKDLHLLKAFENRAPGKYNHIPHGVAQMENIEEYYNKMKICLLDQSMGQDIMMKCYLIQMLVCINRVIDENVRKSTTDKDEKIYEVLKYINENLNKTMTLDGLSEKFYISKYYMAHIFKRVTGYSVNQYITYKRICLAEEMIAEGVSAAEACVLAGFNDYSNFYKTFCKVTGHSPKYSKT